MQQTDVDAAHAEEAEAARRVDRDRRLRHRLLEPVVPAALPGGQGEDRPQLRRRGAGRTATRARSSRRSSRSRTRCRSRWSPRASRPRRSASSSSPAAATSSRASWSAGRPTPTARRESTSRSPLHFAHANGFPASCYAALLCAAVVRAFRFRSIDAIGTDPRYPPTEGWPHLVDQLISTLEQKRTRLRRRPFPRRLSALPRRGAAPGALPRASCCSMRRSSGRSAAACSARPSAWASSTASRPPARRATGAAPGRRARRRGRISAPGNLFKDFTAGVPRRLRAATA